MSAQSHHRFAVAIPAQRRVRVVKQRQLELGDERHGVSVAANHRVARGMSPGSTLWAAPDSR